MNKKLIGLSMILFILGFFMIIIDNVFAETYFSEDFEDFPTDWSISTNGAGTITKSDTQFYEGSYSCKIYSPSYSDRAYATQEFTQISGDHHLHFNIWVDSSVQPATISQIILLYDTSAGTVSFYPILKYQDSAYYLVEVSGEHISVISTEEWIKVDGYYNATNDKIKYYINDVYKGEFDSYGGVSEPHIIYIGDTSTVDQNGFYYLDNIVIDDETEGEPDNPPYYSNVGDNGVTQVGEDVTVSCYWEDDFELNWTIVSHNSTGNYQNFTVSCSGNASWSNKTFQLNYTSNIKVGYLFYGQDNASQWNSTSYYYITTTPLYIVFNHNNSTQGRFYVDLVYTANETENSYDYNETIFLLSATYNSSYVWCNFTYGETTVTENFYDYQTDGNRTLWCNFDVCNATGNGNGGYTETDLHEYFVLGAVISVFVSVIVMLIVIDKKDLIRGK